MDAPVFRTYDLARPWRRATFVASTLAVVEFAVLVALAALVLARPVSHALAGTKAPARPTVRTARVIHTSLPAAHHPRAIHHPRVAPAPRTLPATRVHVLVLNGDGVAGAAGRTAAALQRRGYPIAGVANAVHENYPRTLILYRPGYRAEGVRLAHQMGVRVVGPLDGVAIRSLHGGDLAVILGA